MELGTPKLVTLGQRNKDVNISKRQQNNSSDASKSMIKINLEESAYLQAKKTI